MLKNIWLPASLGTLVVLSPAALAAESLFVKSPSLDARLNAQSQMQAQRLANEFHHARVEADWRLNKQGWNQPAFDVTLPDGQRITLQRQHAYRNHAGTDVLVAKPGNGLLNLSSANSSVADSIFVNRDGQITGSIRHQGKLYSVRPTGHGQHAIIEVDESRMPAEHPEHDYAALFDQAIQYQVPASTTADFSASANTVIKLLVNYTQGAKNAVSDIDGLIDLAVAETNQGYANSGINITVEVAHRAQTSYSESSNISTDRDRYAATSDGYMDEIHTQRDQHGADVGVLILNNSAACGVAKAIGATASTAFAVVHHSCATGYYSFAHEIGHLQGARHDPATDPSTSPYAYGHGYRAPNNAWRTVMAYNCSPSCTRINYWSTPNRTYSDGQVMGTSSQSDNARVLNQTAATIAGFRGDTTPPPPGDTFTNDGNYNIPDNNSTGIQSPIAATGSGTAGTVKVDVRIIHTYIGDLIVDLIAPDGTVYNLHNRSGGGADNLIQSYNVNASSENRAGTWNLRVRDRARVDIGYIDSWSITFN